MMQTEERQLFVFRSTINGTLFEYGRVGANQQEAASSLANDMQKFVDELRDLAKANLKSN